VWPAHIDLAQCIASVLGLNFSDGIMDIDFLIAFGVFQNLQGPELEFRPHRGSNSLYTAKTH
jgi:hypothetical protein